MQVSISSKKMAGQWESNAVQVIAALENGGFSGITLDEETCQGFATYRGQAVPFAFGSENFYIEGIGSTKGEPVATVAALVTFLDTLAALR